MILASLTTVVANNSVLSMEITLFVLVKVDSH